MGCQRADCQATPSNDGASVDEHLEASVLHGGGERQRPKPDRVEVLSGDEIWAAAPGGWWVLCGCVDAYRVKGCKVHAAAPFQPPDTDDEIAWVDLDLDLDLDFEVIGDEVALEDETQFHEHARTMGYPDEVVRGAWSGISWIAAHYTTGEWPFDGTIQRCLDEVVSR
jgi:hypothetical protein